MLENWVDVTWHFHPAITWLHGRPCYCSAYGGTGDPDAEVRVCVRSSTAEPSHVSLDDGRMCHHLLGSHTVEMMVMARIQ